MKDEKTLKNKIEEFNQRIDWFYSDDFDLDRAAREYQETVDLAKEIREDLGRLKNKIEILTKDFTK